VKILLCAVLFCASLGAQTLSFYIDTSNGALPTNQLTPLPFIYSFPDTPEGAAAPIVVRVVNSSSTKVQLTAIYVGKEPNSPASTPNFTVTGFDSGATLAPQAWKLFTLSFTPLSIGSASAYLQAKADTSLLSVATLQGNGTAPQVTLSCNSPLATQCNGSILQPNSATPINFGNTPTTASSAIKFTLNNMGASALNPQKLISLAVATNNPNTPFSLSALPSTLAAGSSVDFTVTFAPGTTATTQINLLLGAVFYPLQGAGTSSTVGDISSLVITYVDATGVRLTAQPGSPIDFGQTVAGTSGAAALTFIVSNPQTTIYPVSVPDVTVSGGGFTLSGLPVMPASIQPGQSISFKVVFSASASGTYTGTLAIGSRLFSLSGQSITSPLPDPSFQLDLQPLTSQHQAHLSVQLASASSVSAIGQLTMQFVPSVQNVTDDPAINFVATGGRQLQVSVASGSQTATFQGQSALTFQTGTTAGTITFTLTFPNKAPLTRSFAISPSEIQITGSTAVRQPPNLVVTLTGYDNTYSAGQLSFTFTDTSGKVLTPAAIQVNVAASFHQYFFTSNTAGGAFSVQASFPVTGDVTQVGSVTANLTNSAGLTTTTQSFQ
jgi:hypothetical protein